MARRTPFSVGRTAAAPLGAERLAAGRRAFGDDLKTACGTFALTESQFHDVGGRMIARIQDGIELRLEELDVDFDSETADGVVTIMLEEKGTYVVNKQTPLRQIWLSSPESGPARFDYRPADATWRHWKTDEDLVALLEREFAHLFNEKFTL